MRLNPYAKSFKRQEYLFAERRRKENEKRQEERKKAREGKTETKRK